MEAKRKVLKKTIIWNILSELDGKSIDEVIYIFNGYKKIYSKYYNKRVAVEYDYNETYLSLDGDIEETAEQFAKRLAAEEKRKSRDIKRAELNLKKAQEKLNSLKKEAGEL